MPTNQYFTQYSTVTEQTTLEDLVVESIKIYGQDMFYLPRRRPNFDKIYGQDPVSYFDAAYEIEYYIKSVMGFDGDRDIMSKLSGLEINDQLILVVSRRSFAQYITAEEDEITRPREGDLLYFPMHDKIFEIKFVDPREFFYQLGHMTTFELTLELFTYSHEKFETGNADIDKIQTLYSLNILDYALTDESGNFLMTEDSRYITSDEYDIEEIYPFADNDTLQDEGDDFLDFSDINPITGEY